MLGMDDPLQPWPFGRPTSWGPPPIPGTPQQAAPQPVAQQAPPVQMAAAGGGGIPTIRPPVPLPPAPLATPAGSGRLPERATGPYSVPIPEVSPGSPGRVLRSDGPPLPTPEQAAAATPEPWWKKLIGDDKLATALSDLTKARGQAQPARLTGGASAGGMGDPTQASRAGAEKLMSTILANRKPVPIGPVPDAQGILAKMRQGLGG